MQRALAFIPETDEPAAASDARLQPTILAERRARAAELAAQRAAARAKQLEDEAAATTAMLRAVCAELDAAQLESANLVAELAERERAVRRAEQRVHSEQALRGELEQERDALARDLVAERRRADDLEQHVQALLDDIDQLVQALKRRVDEAEHAAAVAQAAVAERRLPTRHPATSRRAGHTPHADRAPVDVERLSAALLRLRDATPPTMHRPSAGARFPRALRQPLEAIAHWIARGDV